MNDPTRKNQQSSQNNAVFDPFNITTSHNDHSQSTSIIRLEESGRVFCPLCLERTSLTDIDKVDIDVVEQYIANLFEALDQHSEMIVLRKIVLQILVKILLKKSINLKTDSSFHNILRIIFKIMQSPNFDLSDFSFIGKIYSLASSAVSNSTPLPLASLWKATESMLDYARDYFKQNMIENSSQLDVRLFRFIGSLSLIVNTYLRILSKFAICQVSDLIFPLSEKDDPLIHNRNHYTKTQLYCIDFLSDCLIPLCWPFISNIERVLESDGKMMISGIFEALRECFLTSIRLENDKFLKLMERLDCIFVAHILIQRYADIEIRSQVRSFLKEYAKYYIDMYFGSDNEFRKFTELPDIVEVNHRNAIAFSTGPRCSHTIFYILINCIASKQESEYLNFIRVRKVIKILEQPQTIGIDRSRVFIRAYSYLAASASERVNILHSVDRFLSQVWRKMRQNLTYSEFNEDFCFDQTVFTWAREHPEFIKIFSFKSINYIFNKAIKNGEVEKSYLNILTARDKRYKDILSLYFRDDETALTVLQELVKVDVENNPDASLGLHERILSDLSDTIPALYHCAILEALNQTSNLSPTDRTFKKSQRLLDMLILMLRHCKHFNLVFDDQYINDLFEFAEKIYCSTNQDYDDSIIQFNQLIILLIENDNPFLMKILKNLDYTLLGYMFHRLSNYQKDDLVVESIAQLLIMYDNIDYPLQNNISNRIREMVMDISDWMFSNNKNLHILSLKISQRALYTELSSSTRACIATSLIHMLVRHPKILSDRNCCNIFSSILDIEELKYNPLLNYILDIVPESTRREFNRRLIDSNSDRPISPVFSLSSTDSSELEREQISITSILNQLNEEDITNRSNNFHRIPNSLYVSRAVEDQHSILIETEDWEEVAHEARRNADDFCRDC